jgi:DNA-binding transcriptional ArsR family regulator
MVYNTHMDMFVALADPTRRAILEILATRGELTATALYEQFPVSPQAISQHLKVLREAHLVVMEKRAQKTRVPPQSTGAVSIRNMGSADEAEVERTV